MSCATWSEPREGVLRDTQYTAKVDGIGNLRMLEAVDACNLEHFARFYEASTSKLYGKSPPFHKRRESTHFLRSLSLRRGETVRVLGRWGAAWGAYGLRHTHGTPSATTFHCGCVMGVVPTFVTREKTRAVRTHPPGVLGGCRSVCTSAAWR